MQDEQQPGWVFNPDGKSQVESPAPMSGNGQADSQAQISSPQYVGQEAAPSASVSQELPQVTWTASEYADHPKGAGWFGLLALASLLLSVVVYIVTGDFVSTLVVALVGIILGVFSARQPRVLRYALDNNGIHIENKFYPYASFKSFSISSEQAMSFIQLMPLKRFMPPITIHYDPADESKISSTLISYLPFEEHKPDVVDNLTRRLRL